MTIFSYSRLLAVTVFLFPFCALGWEANGIKEVTVQTKDGRDIVIGTVEFQPAGSSQHFSLHLDHKLFKDYFLSMKEFKCLDGPDEVECHVPYPYANPSVITATDYAWLEHSLMFMFKAPNEFGAKLWNGLYFQLSLTDHGLVGLPQAVDLNRISSPPDNLAVPPFGPEERDGIKAGSHWITSLTIR